MTIALVSHGSGASTTGNGFTTGGINTTGANFIVVGVADSSLTSGTLTDSNSNTWTGLNTYNDSFSSRSEQLFYCENPTVGSGHTFSITGTSNFPSLIIAAFSGVGTSSFDVQNGGNNGFGTSVQTGSITPSLANELLISGCQTDDTTGISINSGFTITDSVSGTVFGTTGQALAYLIQTTATVENPTWSWTNPGRDIGVIASFKASTGGGGDTFANNGLIFFI